MEKNLISTENNYSRNGQNIDQKSVDDEAKNFSAIKRMTLNIGSSLKNFFSMRKR